MRLIVTGSRSWDRPDLVAERLNALLADNPMLTVVHGHCPSGADHHADNWAKQHYRKVIIDRHPAKWPVCDPADPVCTVTDHRRYRTDGYSYCPLAGHRRNQHMVDLGADLVLAFWRGNSAGTRDCLDRAIRAGLSFEVVPYPGETVPAKYVNDGALPLFDVEWDAQRRPRGVADVELPGGAP